MSQIVIGIDPSLTGTGVCIVDYPSGTIRYVTTITPPEIRLALGPKQTLKGVARLVYIRRRVYTIINRMYEKLGGVENCMMDIFIEGYAFGAKGRAVFSVAELGGVLRTMLAERFTSYFDVAPTSLKKFVTGKGNVKKAVMLEKVFRKYGVGSEILKDDNQVDAYSLAQFGVAWHKHFLEEDESLPAYELDAIKKVEQCDLSYLDSVIKK